MRPGLFVCLTSLAACMDAGTEPREDGELDVPDAEGDTGHAGGDGAEFLDDTPTFWKLWFSVDVVDSRIDVLSSELSMTLLGPDGAELCSASGAVDAVVERDDLPTEELVVWWEVTASAWAGSCVDAGVTIPMPSPQLLGVGSMHPEVIAVMQSVADLGAGAESSLNAAYASLDGTVVVYGLAGPTGAFQGEGSPASEAPLSDGHWELRPLYSFPMGKK